MFHKATKQLFPYQLFLLFFSFCFLFHLETLSIFLGTKKADCLLAIDFDFFSLSVGLLFGLFSYPFVSLFPFSYPQLGCCQCLRFLSARGMPPLSCQ